jgi:HEAT repeat protein
MLSLMELAEKHNAVLDTLRELFASRKSKDRFIIIAYLRGALPRDFLLDIVGKGLTDKSSQIRWKAAQACGGIDLKELLPSMESGLSLKKL